MSTSLCLPGPAGVLFATTSGRPPGEIQVAWPFGRRASAGCTLRTQHLSIGDVGAHAAFLSCPTSHWGAQHGVNEYGVAIAVGTSPTAGPPARRVADRAGLTGGDLVRLGLERARSAPAALDVMIELVEACGLEAPDVPVDEDRQYSFLVADSREVFVLETTRGGGSAGGAVSRPFPVGAVLVDGALPEAVPITRVGEPDPRAAASQLRAHSAGSPPGAPVPGASMVAELPRALDEGMPWRVYVAAGSPELSIFVPAFPRTAGGPEPYVPFEVSGEELWRSAEQLRRAVGADEQAGAEVRAVLGAVEDELWAEADDVVGDPARWAEVGASWGGRALESLRSCIPVSD